MSTRKKSEQKKALSQPFKFQDPEALLANGQRLVATNEHSGGTNLIIWKNRTHLPAYSLGDMTQGRLGDFTQMTTPSMYSGLPTSPQVPYWIAQLRHPELAKIMLDLWNNKQYFTVMQMRAIGVSHGYDTQREYGDVAGQTFNYFVQNAGSSILPTPHHHSANTGAAGLVRRFFLGEGVEASTLGSKVHKTGEFANPMYMAARYFLAYCPKLNANQVTREFNSQWIGNSFERERVIWPLVTLVCKRGDAPIVKGHWINNEPLEASMFELWVDKSLEDEASPHPLRTQYVRSIRNPLVKMGIPLVVKDDLYREAFKNMIIPKFKTIKEEKDFVETTVQKVLNKERRSYGVSRSAPVVQEVEAAPMAAAADFPF